MAVIGSGAQLGRDSYLGIAKEGTWGTRVTATNFFEYNSESFKSGYEEILPETMNGTRDFTRHLQGNEMCDGSVECPLNVADPSNILLIAAGLGGAVSTTIVSAGASFSHNFNAGNCTSDGIVGLSFVKRLGDTDVYAYRGCRVNTLTIKAEQGELVQLSAEIVGANGSTTTDSLTSSVVDIDPANFPHVQFFIGNTTASLNASANVQYIQSVELTINNNLVNDATARRLGSRSLDVLPAGRREVRWKVTQRYDTTTAYVASKTQTAYSLGMLIDTGVTVGAGGASTYSLWFESPRCYYNMAEPGISDMNIIQQEVEFVSVRDTTTSYVIFATGYNATSAY